MEQKYQKKEFQFKLDSDLWRLQFQKVNKKQVRFMAICRSRLNIYEQTYTIKQLQEQYPDPEELITDIENICKEEPTSEHIKFIIKGNQLIFIMKFQVGRNLKDLIIGIDEIPQNWKESHQCLLDRINKNEEFILIGSQLTGENDESVRYQAVKRLMRYDEFMTGFDNQLKMLQRIQEDRQDYQIKKLGDKNKAFKKEVRKVIDSNLKVTKSMLKQYQTMFEEFKATTLKIIIQQQETTEKLLKQISMNESSIINLQNRIDENQKENLMHRQLIKEILHNHSDQYNQSFSKFKKELIQLIDENKDCLEGNEESCDQEIDPKEQGSNKKIQSQ